MKRLILILVASTTLAAQVQVVVFTNGIATTPTVPTNCVSGVLYNGSSFLCGSTPAWGGITGTLSAQTDVQSSLDAKEATANKNGANGYAGLDANSKVLAANLPAVSGLTGSVTAAQMPALTGDVTTSAGAVATTLKNTGTAGTYQQVVTDAQGRVTSGVTRTINTTAPVTGGGALTGDLTIACATCTQKIASGSVTFTTTTVASGACQTTVTVAASGAVVNTDFVSEITYRTQPAAATDARLIMTIWLTAGNINFARCNPTAASITPTAIVGNWAVMR